MTKPQLMRALVILVGVGLSGSSFAQGVTVDDIVRALTPPATLAVTVEPRSKVVEASVKDSEPEAVYEAIKDSKLPTIDIEINFAFDSAELTSASKSSLELLAAAMADDGLSEYRFIVGGHTDGKGSAEYNDGLSVERAEAAIQYLVLQGTDPGRLVPTGFGERFLKNTAAPESAVNRRVQIVTIR